MLRWKKTDRSPEDQGPEVAAFIAMMDRARIESLRSMGVTEGLEPTPIKPATHRRVEFAAKIGNVSDLDLHRAMVELWSKVLDEVEAAYPEGGWDILIVYLTPETGSVVIYPQAMAQLDRGEEEVRVSLDVGTWARAYGEVFELDADSREFESAYKRMLRSFLKSLKDGIEDKAVLPRFKALKKRPSFGVYYVDSAESIRRENLNFLWGNKPPKGITATSAKELFEAVLGHETAYPQHSMVFEDGVLRVVKFQGADYNDKHVDLIESVPNAAELCRDLRELLLMATRITPAAVKRLQRLLPDVDVQVLVYDDDAGWRKKSRPSQR